MSKVTVVGAGNVGASVAKELLNNNIADEIVLIDIKPGLSEGKAMDIMQSAAIMHPTSRLKGVTNDYEATADSDVVVITSGIPRKPGMTREELIGVNAGIVKSVMSQALAHSPKAIFICISNPMDTMTYLMHKTSNLPANRIIGMGGALDSARFRYFLSIALGANINEVEGIVIGGHGDTTMIPLTRYAAYRGIPASTLIPAERLEKVAADTMVGGATLTKLLGTSAWYAPGAAGAQMVRAILSDEKALISASCYVDGQYGQKDLCVGVPAIIGRNGVEKIVEFDLDPTEKAKFEASAAAVRKTNGALADALK